MLLYQSGEREDAPASTSGAGKVGIAKYRINNHKVDTRSIVATVAMLEITRPEEKVI